MGVWLDAVGACKTGAVAETTSRKTLAFAKSRASPARLAHSGLAVGLSGMTLHARMSASAYTTRGVRDPPGATQDVGLHVTTLSVDWLRLLSRRESPIKQCTRHVLSKTLLYLSRQTVPRQPASSPGRTIARVYARAITFFL